MGDIYKDITQTTFYDDLHEIFYDNNTPYRSLYEITLHTVEDDYDIEKFIKLERTKDFLNKIGDLMYIEVTFLLGNFVKKIYPERRNLELTIIKKPTKEHKEYTGIFDKKPKEEKTRYKAILINDANISLLGKEADRMTTENLNQNGYISVKLQLMDRRLEAQRSCTVSGIYWKAKYEDLIRALIHKRASEIKVDGKPVSDGIDILKPSNDNVLKHIIIPEDTLMYDLPGYLQEKGQGVYNAGIGTYFQRYDDKWFWYIYSLYNFKAFEKSTKKKIVFLNAPQSKFDGTEDTYLVKSEDLIWIACTGDIKFNDDSDNNAMNTGNGFRSVYADSFMTKPVKMTEEGPIAIRKKLNRQTKLNDREDNFEYAPYGGSSESIITTNPYDEASKVNARNLSLVNLQWDNSDSSIFEPCMPCKIKFEQGIKVIELKGIVANVQEVTGLIGHQYSSDVYRTSCIITIFIEKYNERNLE